MNILLHLIKYNIYIYIYKLYTRWYKFFIFLSLPAFLQGGVDQKLQKHWQAQKNQKCQKAIVTKPWQAQNKLKKETKVLGSMGALGVV